MFVVSVKSSRIKIILAVIFVCVVVFFSFLFMGKEHSATVISEGGISLRASDEKERISFLSQFGWDVDTEPLEVKEIVIPSEFDTAYTEYNALQKRQSFDLEKYQGQVVKRWTYNINNYPGYEGEKDFVQANLLIFNGNVIGADITVFGDETKIYTIDFPDNKGQVENATEN